MGINRQFRIARLWSNRELRKLSPLFTGDIVNVSAWDDRDKEGGHYKDYFTQATHYYYTNTAGVRGYQNQPDEFILDLTTDLPSELHRRFEVVLNHTTLEHIFEITRAFANLCAMTKDIAIIVVPFSQVQHETESYGDYWRLTPSCIRRMLRENGLETVYEAESHHRNAAIYLLLVGSRNPQKWRSRMPKYEPIKEAGHWIGARRSIRGLVRKLFRRHGSDPLRIE